MTAAFKTFTPSQHDRSQSQSVGAAWAPSRPLQQLRCVDGLSTIRDSQQEACLTLSQQPMEDKPVACPTFARTQQQLANDAVGESSIEITTRIVIKRSERRCKVLFIYI
ncbi:MAG TPA: hypothetical protein DDZ51_26975 [Planctomycetaceae bacterium]|nr:hypothetical protein [Planctomycetaceae bacterium]